MTQPARKRGGVVLGVIIGAAGGSALPPVFVDGEQPAGLPESACHVAWTGPLQGQRICDVVAGGAMAPPDGCEWRCTVPGDAGDCALLECVTP